MNLSDLAKSLRDAVHKLRDRRKKLTVETAQLQAERESLIAAPLSRSDLRETLANWIDQQGARWADAQPWAGLFRSMAYPNGYNLMRRASLTFGEVEDLLADRLPDLRDGSIPFIHGGGNHARLCDGALFFFFGEQIKPKILELFDEHYAGLSPIDDERAGPPIHERRQRLRKIDERIGEIAGLIRDLDAEAGALSVT